MNVVVAINGIAAEDNSDSVECRLSVSVYHHVSSSLLFAFDFAFVFCVLPWVEALCRNASIRATAQLRCWCFKGGCKDRIRVIEGTCSLHFQKSQKVFHATEYH